MATANSPKDNFVEQLGEDNPLNGINVGRRATPKLIDFDGDGDLDLFVGVEAGTIHYLENIGSAAQPDFVERIGVANPFDGVIIDEERSNPSLADFDGDGQVDAALVGNLSGTLRYFSYDGSQFVEQMGDANPFDGVTLPTRSAPAFVDLDGDGLLDLVVGDGDGLLSFFRNDGAGFTQQTGAANPLDGLDVGDNSTPTFEDIDGDGDLDAFVGEFFGGTVRYFENTGTATAPQFVERVGAESPFEGISIRGSAPALGDLDGDGDIDALIGGVDGVLTYLANGPSVSLSVEGSTPSETGEIGRFIVTSSAPAPEGGLTVEYTVEASDYAATAGEDYEALSGQVTIAAGETTAVIELVPLDDQAFDPIETVTLTLTPPNGYLVPATAATAYLAIADNEGEALLAQTLNEPNFKDQWHLWNTPYNRGTAGVDINVLEVWKDYSGKGVKVGIVDSGVDFTHPDLAANYDPSPNPDEDRIGRHGTSVAGIVAAVAGNGLGGSGVAPGAAITSFVRTDEDDLGAVEEVLKAQMQMDVANNSWGVDGFIADFRAPNYIDEGKIIKEVVEKGRNGLGTVYVFSAGNSRDDGESANYSNLRNSRYTVSVAALTADGKHTSYSSPGSSLLISAFGSEGGAVFSTDIVGEPGYTSEDYTFGFSGTSAAAPMVTGVVALMLEANPELGYRDVQEILAYSATWNDANNESWIVNNATNWNGGGLRHSSDYGFGQVNALAAVRLAETWQTQHTAANEQRVSITSAAELAIPDADSVSENSVSDTIRVAKGVEIDYVEIDITINHEFYNDLILTLTSPTGVVSELANRVPRNDSGVLDPSNPRGYDPNKVEGKDFTYTFTTTADWGETGVGDWTLTVTDAKTGDTGVLKDWTLNLYGDALTPDDTYIYTNEFAHANLKDDHHRHHLSDVNGGDDILNAAAVTTDLHLDLNGGKTSTIAGKHLHIDADTLIEQAFGGDGDDQVVGNLLDNTLHGGRGDDTVAGGFGSDAIYGDAGDDVLRGDLNSRDSGGVRGGDDLIHGGAGHDIIGGKGGHDTLYGDEGNDRLFGDAGNDWLSGGSGNDVLTGGDDGDIFALGLDQGLDIITDFTIGEDWIELLGGISFAQTSRLQLQQDTLLSFGDQTLALLQGVTADHLTENSFLPA